MRKALHKLGIDILTFLYYLVFTVVPVTIILGCLKLIAMMFVR